MTPEERLQTSLDVLRSIQLPAYGPAFLAPLPPIPPLPPVPSLFSYPSVTDTPKAKPVIGPRFKKGDRIRLKHEYRADRYWKIFTAVVIDVRQHPHTCPCWAVTIKRELKGAAHPVSLWSSAGQTWDECGQWELIPPDDLSLNGSAVALARAILAGDNHAARAAADLVCEIVNTPPPRQ